jgi:hypothetical protein
VAITDAVSRKLWMLSGNECAFKLCTARLFNEHGVYVAERAHIVSAKKAGPRGEEDLPPGAGTHDDFENIILLCEPHHKTIDSLWKDFSVDKLVTWKREHEDRFSNAAEKIKDSITAAQQIASTMPTRDNSALWPGHGAEEFAHDLPLLQHLENRLSRLAPLSRRILAVMVTHGVLDGGKLRLDIVEAGRIFQIPYESVEYYVQPLVTHDFVAINHESASIFIHGVSPEYWGERFWVDLREMHQRLPESDAVARVIEQSDFAVLGN